MSGASHLCGLPGCWQDACLKARIREQEEAERSRPRFAVVDLFKESVFFETDSIGEAVRHAQGMVGTVVVDRPNRAVYDGEYQRWYSLEDYGKNFPRVLPLLSRIAG